MVTICVDCGFVMDGIITLFGKAVYLQPEAHDAGRAIEDSECPYCGGVVDEEE